MFSKKTTTRFTRQREVLERMEEAARRELAKIIPEIGMLHPDAIDDALVLQIDKMVAMAKHRLRSCPGKNGASSP